MIEKLLQKTADLLNKRKDKTLVQQPEKTVGPEIINQEKGKTIVDIADNQESTLQNESQKEILLESQDLENLPIVDSKKDDSQKGVQKSADKLKDKLAKFIPKGNALANANQVIDLVCDALQEYSLNSSIRIPALSLYISGSGHDELLGAVITSPEFEKKLRLKLTHKSIFAAADDSCKWFFYSEKPQNEQVKEFIEGFFILEEKVDDAAEQPEIPIALATLARITALKGELLKETYLLDAKTTQSFNIGRSNEKNNIQLDNGYFHKNFVAIKDNERQEHISRQHAYIIFDRKKSFCLKAEKLDKTFLFRDGKKIPLKENTTLQDGDQIKLCEKPNDVVLLFEFVDENSNTVEKEQIVETTKNPETNVLSNDMPTGIAKPIMLQFQPNNGNEEKVEIPIPNFPVVQETFDLPALEQFTDYPEETIENINIEIENKKQIIKQTLGDFGITITNIMVTVGATVTLYELVLARGVSANKIKNIDEDIARALRVPAVRIISPFKDRGTVALEAPNNKSQIVGLKSILETAEFQNCGYELPLALGKTIDNKPQIIDLAAMPHILIGGATNNGKSVCLNAMLSSLLHRKSPAELKLILIDPKINEFSIYKKLEKRFNAPNIQKMVFTTDLDEITDTLQALRDEMNRRLTLFATANVRNIQEYNTNKTAEKSDYLPRIVLIIDEFVDIMGSRNKVNEDILLELVRKSRAQGIHVVVATQRPSAKQCSSEITSQFTARIAFKVTKWQDSIIILGDKGAEKLIGKGDMLFSFNSEIERIQGAFISTDEVKSVVEFIEKQKY